MIRLAQIGTVVAILAATGLGAQQEAPQSPFKPFDRAAFEQSIRATGATEQQLATFRSEVGELGVGIAADNLMRAVHPAFDAAVTLAMDGEPKAALELTKVLAGTTDSRLQGFCRYHLARVFLDADDPEGAVEVLHQFLNENASVTPLDSEAIYFYGQALAEIPVTNEAIDVFNAYLKWFPDAPERFRATAHQRMRELISQGDSPLHEMADDMKKLERDIRKTKTGDPTQFKQEEIIEMLQKLIDELVKQESQSGGAPSGNSRSRSPASVSKLPGGTARIGNLKDVKDIAKRWGDMKDRDRKAIEAELQNNLPPHHRKLLEEYYKKLNRGGK